MVLTPSTMLSLGTPAPDFDLPEVVSGGRVRLSDQRGKKALLVIFLCRHCPYVKHIQQGLAGVSADYADNPDLSIVGISSNDAAAYPEDAPDKLREMAVSLGLRFPIGYDESQKAARDFTAACTPDFFLFDGALRLAYRGQMDESRPGNGKPVTGRDLRGAIDALLGGRAPSQDQKPSIGCNIKWKPGQEPAYFASR